MQTRPRLGFMFSAFGLEDGDRVYQRNERHRAMVNAINCIRILDYVFTPTNDLRGALTGAIGCSINLSDELN